MAKEEQSKPLRLKDLPKKLQQKYKNSIVFEKENQKPVKKYEFDADKLRKRKINKQKTLQQKIEEFTIDKTEQKYLFQVFNKLAGSGESFGRDQIADVLKKMEMDMTKAEIELMIWEFDENLNRRIDQKEFITMYKKCMMDKAAAEPKKLFHLAQFLMYCQNGKYKVTVEDSLELLYVRAQNEASSESQAKDLFEEEIKIIFGEEYEIQEDGVEKCITFKEYLEKINKKAIEKRKKEIEKLKTKLKYI